MFNRFRKSRTSSFQGQKKEGKESIRTKGSPHSNQENKQDVPKRRERIKIDFLIHDLKVPLAVIQAGLTSMLERREKYGSLTELQEKVLTRALRNTRVTQTLVGDALELGRSREGIVNLSNCRICDVVRETMVEVFDLADDQTAENIKKCNEFEELRQILEQKGLGLLIDESLWCQKICLDEVKMSQILRNLLGNALKYRKKRVELRIEKTDVSLVLSVKDDGDGIPSAYHKKIFECYFQMDTVDACPVRGHGLGLAGVMVLVEDLGGRLFLDSDAGQGARFLVKLPLSTNQ
ncbi:MAG: HAMP domain-containing histidine kinase [Desulfobacterales bacterium]|nr:HAMP domain-containing histidine kinase [Desulfobacterales bacterium]